MVSQSRTLATMLWRLPTSLGEGKLSIKNQWGSLLISQTTPPSPPLRILGEFSMHSG